MKKKSDYTDAWFLFMEELEEAKNKLNLKKNEECFFRGHIDEKHKLMPGLLRAVENNGNKMSAELWDIEYSMFYEFRARAKEVHQGNLTDWDILFYMQHHGCKTRLLDWTENFGVALYFALSGKKDSNFSPTIWMMNPYALNEYILKERDLVSPEFLDIWNEKDKEYHSYSDILRKRSKFKWNKPVALYPIRRVDRLTTQGGYFTIHGDNIKALDDVVPENLNIWKKIILPKAAIPDAQDFLEMAGIHAFTMFPDLDGLAEFLNRKYFN